MPRMIVRDLIRFLAVGGEDCTVGTLTYIVARRNEWRWVMGSTLPASADTAL